MPAHEALNDEMARNPDAEAESRDWEPMYRTHPVVVETMRRGHPLPYPVALYVDGVKLTKQIAVGGKTTSFVLWFTTCSQTSAILCVWFARAHSADVAPTVGAR